MPEKETYKEIAHDIQAHLGMADAVIQQMPSNSALCQAWCITFVSAIQVFVSDKEKHFYAFLALIPKFLFLLFDTSYLAFEIFFRQSYNDIIVRLHKKRVFSSETYGVTPTGKLLEIFF